MEILIVVLSISLVVASTEIGELQRTKDVLLEENKVDLEVMNISKRWQNSYDNHHKYSAPSGYAVYSITSQHSNKQEDRVGNGC